MLVETQEQLQELLDTDATNGSNTVIAAGVYVRDENEDGERLDDALKKYPQFSRHLCRGCRAPVMVAESQMQLKGAQKYVTVFCESCAEHIKKSIAGALVGGKAIGILNGPIGDDWHDC